MPTKIPPTIVATSLRIVLGDIFLSGDLQFSIQFGKLYPYNLKMYTARALRFAWKVVGIIPARRTYVYYLYGLQNVKIADLSIRSIYHFMFIICSQVPEFRSIMTSLVVVVQLLLV